MSNMLLDIAFFALFGFLAMYFIYRPVINKYTQTLEIKLSSLAFPYIWALYAACAVVAYFTVDLRSFVESLTLYRMLIPLIAAAVIYASTLLFSQKIICAVVAAALAITIWSQPLGVGNTFPLDPLWLRLIVLFFAFIFCMGSRITNILPHTFVLPNIVILCGLILLALINSSPLYIAVCAAVLIGLLAAYLSLNYYTVTIDLDEGACVAISYLVCSLLLMNLGEFCFPSCMIFTLIFWAEMLVALYNRLLITHIGALRENTNYFFAAQRYSLQTLTSAILKVGIVLLFIGWFQLFSINSYSLIIIALLIVIWLDSSFGRRSDTPSTFADINRKFVADVKQNLQEVKKLFNSERKDKK